MLTSLTLLSLDSVKASFTLFSLNRKVKSALIGTQTARALVLLEKEGVHLIHGQAAVVTELDVEVALLLGLDLGEDGDLLRPDFWQS